MRKNKDFILLESEGPILKAALTNDGYVIYDKDDCIVDILSPEEMQKFIHGDLILDGTDGKEISYSRYPGSMKPDLKKLDEFTGIDTTNKTY